MKLLFIGFVLVLSGCQHGIPKNDLAARHAIVATWITDRPVEFSLGVIEENDHLILLVVDLCVNRNHARLVLDTGSNKCVFSPAFAKKIGISNSGLRVLNRGAGGSVVEVGLVDNLDLEFAKVANTYVSINDVFVFENARLGLANQIDGIFGLDLLTSLGAVIDVKNRKISFSSSHTLQQREAPDISIQKPPVP